MELKDFVKNALKDIVTAVVEAREEMKGGTDGALIAPRLNSGGLPVSPDEGFGMAFPIEFDLIVAVTDTSQMQAGTSGGAKGGILSVVSFSAKMEASGSTSDQRVTTQRIKFSVPVRYPQSPRKKSQAPRERGEGESWKTA